MKIFVQKYLPVLLVAFVVNAAGTSHVAALSPGAHHMNQASNPVSCASICLSAPAGRYEYDDTQREEDDQPNYPFHGQFVRNEIDIHLYTNIISIPDRSELSGGPPLYRLCCVVRR